MSSYRAIAPAVFAPVRRLAGNRVVAEDAVDSERALATLTPLGRAVVWLYKIAGYSAAATLPAGPAMPRRVLMIRG